MGVFLFRKGRRYLIIRTFSRNFFFGICVLAIPNMNYWGKYPSYCLNHIIDRTGELRQNWHHHQSNLPLRFFVRPLTQGQKQLTHFYNDTVSEDRKLPCTSSHLLIHNNTLNCNYPPSKKADNFVHPYVKTH